ncbi:aryl hydrocarbon receptor [Amia ocellicauda]|uniref:aryl hydrocarbon receptor n=1 Tax=Amia ocellicauda TaxID=2972642 RepID=UPI003464475C
MVNPAVYAGKKRSRPAPKLKTDSQEEVKTNSSKRHRDKLNVELEHLADLLPLPKHVSSKLDKLSIMRLTVSYLRAKSFFSNSLQKLQNGQPPSSTEIPEGELMLQALNGFVLVMTGDGTVFYTSHNIQDHLGFYQSDVINQSIFDLIHTEDRAEFTRQLTHDLARDTGDKGQANGAAALCEPGQQTTDPSICLDRSFVCRMRCLLDCASGFLTLQIQGKLKALKEFGQPAVSLAKLALFAIAVPIHPPAIMEIRTRNLAFRTKHKLDFTPTWVDNKGKTILGWSVTELVEQTGYFYIHFEDLLYCAGGHIKLMKNGNSGLTVFRLLTKNYTWVWIRAIAHLVYEEGKPSFILATQRPITDAEGEEHMLKRAKQERFSLDSLSLLYDSTDVLHPSARAFLQQVESRHKAQGPCQSTVIGANISKDEPPYIFRPPEAPCPQAWPQFPTNVSIWELLWHYGLCQDDLDIILNDEAIARLEAPNTAEDLLSLVPPAVRQPSLAQSSLASVPPGMHKFAPESHMEASVLGEHTLPSNGLSSTHTSPPLSLASYLWPPMPHPPLPDRSAMDSQLFMILSSDCAQQSHSSSSLPHQGWLVSPPEDSLTSEPFSTARVLHAGGVPDLHTLPLPSIPWTSPK